VLFELDVRCPGGAGEQLIIHLGRRLADRGAGMGGKRLTGNGQVMLE
jgi:hypothetical protein